MNRPDAQTSNIGYGYIQPKLIVLCLNSTILNIKILDLDCPIGPTLTGSKPAQNELVSST